LKIIVNRLYVFVPLALAGLLQNLVHESLHYLAARLCGEAILEFRFLTNGWLTSQVIYATPVEERTGAHWLAIAWLPAIVTTLIGFTLYASRNRWLTPWPPLNLGLWYAGALFMTIDPLYFGVLSWLMRRSDVSAAEIIGWPTWPFQGAALAVAAWSLKLVLSWRREARRHLPHYSLPG